MPGQPPEPEADQTVSATTSSAGWARPRHPLASRWGARCAVVLTAACALGAGTPPHDPVHVFYSAGACTTGVLEIELWSRTVLAWRPHPDHPRIMADTCQLEDAGDLLNEIRVRCTDPANPARASDWITGVQVYEPADAPGCRPPELGARPQRSPRIALTAPSADVPVRNATRLANVEGRVRLTHDLVVLADGSFDADANAKLMNALIGLVGQDGDRLGPMRLGWLGFTADPKTAIGATSGVTPLSSSPQRLPAQLRELTGVKRPVGVHEFAPAMDAALASLAGSEAPGDRQTILAVVNARADYPFGLAAGMDPAYRIAVLAAVERAARAGVALEVLAVGSPERDLPELAAQVRQHIRAGGAGGGVSALPEPEALATALVELRVLSMREVRVENLATGSVAEPLEWDRAGRFHGSIPMQSGRNLLRVRALLSSGEDIVADFERQFDPSALRDELRAAERARMKRAREGEVTVDVEDK